MKTASFLLFLPIHCLAYEVNGTRETRLLEKQHLLRFYERRQEKRGREKEETVYISSRRAIAKKKKETEGSPGSDTKKERPSEAEKIVSSEGNRPFNKTWRPNYFRTRDIDSPRHPCCDITDETRVT